MSHIKFLENNISKLFKEKITNLTIPTCFEYYSAIMLSNIYNTTFNVWKDVSQDEKKKFNFPIRDKGIDLINNQFTMIGQSKYYIKGTITYGKLSTFLATDKIVNDIKFDMILIRLSESKIDSHIKTMISKGILIDIKIPEKDFLQKCKECKERNVNKNEFIK